MTNKDNPDKNQSKPQGNAIEEISEDHTVIRQTYPDPVAIFSFRLQSLQEIKEECFVVLDANVLLLPYTVSPNSLSEIERTYKVLSESGRLKLPAQAAREFAKNRAIKLTDLNQQLLNKKSELKVVSIGGYPLLEGLPEYVAAKSLEADLNAKVKEYQKALGNVVDQVRAWRWNDPVSEIYRKFFIEETIVETPIDAKAVEADLSRRNIGKIPPGYKDAAKLENASGDLEIWHSILELGRTHQRSVIFVSGDEKSDWWHRSGDQALYPRFELVDEFRRISDGQSFHIVKLSDLLGLFGAQQEAVEELRKEESVPQRTSSSFTDLDISACALLLNWLRREYPTTYIFNSRSSSVIFVAGPENQRIEIDVIVQRDTEHFSQLVQRIETSQRHGLGLISVRQLTDFITCIICERELLAHQLIDSVKWGNSILTQAHMWTGYIDGNGEFVPIAYFDLF